MFWAPTDVISRWTCRERSVHTEGIACPRSREAGQVDWVGLALWDSVGLSRLHPISPPLLF